MRYPMLFAACALVFVLVLAYIAHQNYLIRVSYQTQRAKQQLVALQQRRNELIQKLALCKRHESIKRCAEKELWLVHTSVDQISKL